MLVAGVATFLTIAIVVIVSIVLDDGHLVYVLDDAGIHLSIARQLTQHTTWGVSTGTYVSATSSPGWTIALSGITLVVPSWAEAVPLVLNIAAVGWILWLFAANQTIVKPRGHDWASYFLAVFIPVVILFLPAMTMVGMEHLLHAALFVQLLVLLPKLETRPLRARAVWPFLLVVFLASAVRFETLFVAVGCVLVLLARTIPALSTPATRANWTRRAAVVVALLTGLVAALPLAVYGLVNRAFGEGFLPNSIAAKAAIGQRGLLTSPADAIRALESDQVLLFLLVVALAYVVATCFGGPSGAFMPAGTFVVATLLHGFYGDMHYFERYQTYLVIGGTLVLLLVASEVVSARWHRATLAFLAVALLLVSVPVKIGLLYDTPLASSNTYRQRYQMGKFFGQYYRGQTVATGELGYATFFHDGPVVDFLGLGSPEVVRQLEKTPHLSTAYVSALVDRLHVAAIGVYPATLALSLPDSWYLAGEWQLDERNVSTFGRVIDFYAPNEQLGRELDRKLRAFAPQLPSHVNYLDRAAIVQRFLEAQKR